ncbi:DUF5956 family protein [Paenarthrobacter sp. NPDC089989]|uniref:DUF5956 family protein n=1 Tax=unclassified Paenarthrobacter TaxID=2634190 RepID=UPI0037F62EEC
MIRALKVDQTRYQKEIDDTIDEYIAGASIPPRPRGFNWYLRLPSGKSLEDLDHQLNEGIRLGASIAPTPIEVLRVFQETTKRFYAH